MGGDEGDPIPLEPMEPAGRAAPARVLGFPPGPGGAAFGEGWAGNGTVGPGIVCAGCGYALAGLPFSGKCPECSMAVERSLRGPMLAFAGVGYLRDLHRGVCMVLAAIAAMIVLFVVAMLGQVGLSAMGSPPAAWFDFVTSAVGLLPTVTGLFGYWLFTTPDPALSHGEQPAAARKVVRAMTLVQLGASLAGFVLELATPSAAGAGLGSAAGVLAIVCGVVGGAAWCAQFFAVMMYVRWLAMRIPDTEVMDRAKMYLWLLPVLAVPGCAACGLGTLAAFIMYIILMDQVRGHLKTARERAEEAERWAAGGGVAPAFGPGRERRW